MPLITTSILASLTLPYLSECIISNAIGNSPGFVYKSIPKLAERLKKQFSDTKPEVNGHLQKAILSAHWMATTVFVEQMHKKNLLKDAYTNVSQTIKAELKKLANEEYHTEEISPDSYDVAKLIKLPKEKEVVEQLESKIFEFHLKLLDKKVGRVEDLNDYKKLKEFIQNGWKEENLNWFQLMTAFLNQLLKGDNNKAKDFFQNQTLSEIKLKLDDFESYAKECKRGIGEKRFNDYWDWLKKELSEIKKEVKKGFEEAQIERGEIYSEVKLIRKDLIELRNKEGERRELNLNVFGQYKTLSSEIDALKIEIAELKEDMEETLEFIKDEENPKKKARFEKDYTSNEEMRIRKFYEIEQKQKDLKEFTSNIEKTWLSVYAENSPRLSEARVALENGDFDRANRILGNDILQHEFEQIGKIDSLLLDKKESLAQEFMVKGNLILTQKEDKDWFSLVDKYYAQAVELHESYGTCFTHAHFLQEHRKFNRASTQYENALKYTSNDYERATTLNNLGNLQRAKNELEKAELSYQEALEIYRKLAEVNPQAYLSYVATTLNNLAVLQRAKNELEKSELSYQEALEIRRKLAEVNPQAYLSDVATTLNNLGNLQRAKNELEKAELSYQEALEIYRKLAEVNPQAYLSYVATTLNNLAVLQRAKNELEKSELSYQEALEIYRKLAEVNPQAYLSDVAMTLNNLAVLQRAKNELEKAELSYQEALEIRRKLAEVNPQAYLSYVATTLNNLAVLQSDKNELEKAELSYQEALEIRRKLAEVNPQAYLSYVATTLNNLAVLQSDKNELEKAELSYQEALEIRRKLAEVNPQAYHLGLSSTLINLSIFYLQSVPEKEKSLDMSFEAYMLASPFLEQVHVSVEYCQKAVQIWNAWGEDLKKHLEAFDSARPDSEAT